MTMLLTRLLNNTYKVRIYGTNQLNNVQHERGIIYILLVTNKEKVINSDIQHI